MESPLKSSTSPNLMTSLQTDRQTDRCFCYCCWTAWLYYWFNYWNHVLRSFRCFSTKELDLNDFCFPTLFKDVLPTDRQVYVRGLVLAADGLAGVDGFVRGKRSLCQVQLLVPLIADGQLPGLEQDAWLPVGQHLVGGDNSCTPGIPGVKVVSHKLELKRKHHSSCGSYSKEQFTRK